MAYTFGSTLDQVAQQRNFYDNLNLRVAENAQSAYQKAQADQTEADRFGIRQNEEDRRQQQQQQYQFFQANQAEADRAQERAQQKYQFGATEAERATSRGDEAYRFNANLQATKDQNATVKTERSGDQQYAEAVNMINSGVLKDETQIPKLFPNLTKEHIDSLSVYFKNMADQSVNSGAAAEAGAAGYNAKVDELRRQKALATLNDPTKTPTSSWYSFGMSSKPSAADVAAKARGVPALPTSQLPPLSQGEIDPIVEQMYKNPKNVPAVNFDPVSQRFIPVKPPSNYIFNRTGTNAPSNIASVPPPTAPGAAPPPPPSPYNFAGGVMPDQSQVVAPQPATAAPAIVGNSQSSPAAPASQSDYDALPSGAWYLRPDGALARKK